MKLKKAMVDDRVHRSWIRCRRCHLPMLPAFLLMRLCSALEKFRKVTQMVC